MADLPKSVLVCCNLNSVRSPMVEAMLKHIYGHRIYVDSVGVRVGEPDPFAIAVMDEIGIDISKHRSKSFDELEDSFFDLVISLTPEAQHRAVELTRTMASDLEYWPTPDPTETQGSRETILAAYRALRDALYERVEARFGRLPSPGG